MSWFSDETDKIKQAAPNILTGGLAHPNDPNTGALGTLKTIVKTTTGQNVGNHMPGIIGDAPSPGQKVAPGLGPSGMGAPASGGGAAPAQSPRDAIQAIRDQQHTQNQGILDQMTKNDQDYAATAKGQNSGYRSAANTAAQKEEANFDQARAERQGSLTNSQNQYSSTVEPALKNSMETAQRNASGAMSLQESMDPNNAVHQANESKYNQQAVNEGRQGLSDVGILGALGAQNASRQIGASGLPMTGGQMASIYGQNQSAAGQAMAATQQREQALRDQGLAQGYSQSELAYQNGIGAQNTAQNRTNDYQNAGIAARNEAGNLSSQATNYGNDSQNLVIGNARDEANANMGVAGLQQSLGQGEATRQLSENQAYNGGQIQDYQGVIQGQQAVNAANAATNAGYVQAGATVGGAVLGNQANNFFGSASTAAPAATTAASTAAPAAASTAAYTGADAASIASDLGGLALGNPYAQQQYAQNDEEGPGAYNPYQRAG